jgi:predicted  nucleic acid-binding Zn-ribbon protein
MSAEETYPELEQRVRTLGARIAGLRSKMEMESKWDKVADARRLLALESRQAVLTEKLAELGRGGFGILRRIKEEIAVVEDDFTAMADSLGASTVGTTPRPSV